MKLTPQEKTLLNEMKFQPLIPTKSRVDGFRGLLSKGLIQHLGENKYGASETGSKYLARKKPGRKVGSKNKKSKRK